MAALANTHKLGIFKTKKLIFLMLWRLEIHHVPPKALRRTFWHLMIAGNP
jgi:hypothetical protein